MLDCTRGTRRCEGDVAQICGPNGRWAPSAICRAGCASGVCRSTDPQGRDCHSLSVQGAPQVQPRYTGEPVPAARGGMLVDGTYELVDLAAHEPPGNPFAPIATVLVLANGELQQTVLSGAEEQRTSGTVMPEGTSLKLQLTCPAAPTPIARGFTVDGPRLILHDWLTAEGGQGRTVAVFRRRPEISGIWMGEWQTAAGRGALTLSLLQCERLASGTVRFTNLACGEGGNVFFMVTENGVAGTVLSTKLASGEVVNAVGNGTISGDEMSGTFTGSASCFGGAGGSGMWRVKKIAEAASPRLCLAGPWMGSWRAADGSFSGPLAFCLGQDASVTHIVGSSSFNGTACGFTSGDIDATLMGTMVTGRLFQGGGLRIDGTATVAGGEQMSGTYSVVAGGLCTGTAGTWTATRGSGSCAGRGDAP